MTVIPADLNTHNIRKKTFKEVLRGNEFKNFISKDANGIIQLEINTSKGAGTYVEFSLLGAQDVTAGFRTGTEVQNGNEEELTFYNDRVTVENLRRGILIANEKYENIKTPMRLQEEIKPALLDVFAERMGNDIVDSAEVTATPNRARVLFGATDGNFNATLATALANIDGTDDTLSVDMIKIAVKKAENLASASNDVAARRIRPFMASVEKMGAQVNNYVLFVDPDGADQLTSSTDWKDLRAADRNNEISNHFFTGSEYLGTVHGVLVFQVNRLERLIKAGAGAASIDVHQALLCGAQSFGLAYGMTGKFNMKDDTDYGFNVGINYHQIYGVDLLKFNGIEQGVVHLFHAASA